MSACLRSAASAFPGAFWALSCGAAIAAGSSAGPRPQLEARELLGRHSGHPVVIAHRGASEGAPENTLVAYRLAMELGAAAAETDLRTTADGVVVAMHDATVDRTTDGTGPLEQLTLEQLQSLDAGAWKAAAFAHERVPTLAELLDLAGEDLHLCLELKGGAGLVEALAAQLAGRTHGIVLFSFDPVLLEQARSLLPELPRLWLARRPEDGSSYDGASLVSAARELDVDLVGGDHRALDARVVSQLQAAGLPVFTWTVDHPREVRRVFHMGVDGIISNRPAATAALVERLAR